MINICLLFLFHYIVSADYEVTGVWRGFREVQITVTSKGCLYYSSGSSYHSTETAFALMDHGASLNCKNSQAYSNSFTQNASGSSCSCCSSNMKILRDSLSLTTLGDIKHRLPENRNGSCAVCLNKLRKKSQVWELSNCCHVFHKLCLERWLSYDSRLTCPLCRASLFTASPLPPTLQPSWAVERMLYLFGDDLLP